MKNKKNNIYTEIIMRLAVELEFLFIIPQRKKRDLKL